MTMTHVDKDCFVLQTSKCASCSVASSATEKPTVFKDWLITLCERRAGKTLKRSPLDVHRPKNGSQGPSSAPGLHDHRASPLGQCGNGKACAACRRSSRRQRSLAREWPPMAADATRHARGAGSWSPILRPDWRPSVSGPSRSFGLWLPLPASTTDDCRVVERARAEHRSEARGASPPIDHQPRLSMGLDVVVLADAHAGPWNASAGH